MNKNVRKLLQNFQIERIEDEERAENKRRRLAKGIEKSTNKAYLLVWKSILDQYRINLHDKKHKNIYYITINTINLDEMIHLTKRKLIKANLKYLEELKDYSQITSKEIVGAEIDYETISMVFPDKLFENLEKDSFELVSNNTYGIATTKLESYIEDPNKNTNPKSKSKKISIKR